MRMNHKPQKSDLESLSLFFSPKRGKNLRDSLRKLDASKDKGRVFGGVSHFVLRVRNLSDLISYLGNATLRTLREGDGDILPLFTNLGKVIFIIKVCISLPLLKVLVSEYTSTSKLNYDRVVRVNRYLVIDVENKAEKLGRGSLCNMVNTLCPLLQTKEKQ